MSTITKTLIKCDGLHSVEVYSKCSEPFALAMYNWTTCLSDWDDPDSEFNHFCPLCSVYLFTLKTITILQGYAHATREKPGEKALYSWDFYGHTDIGELEKNQPDVWWDR